MSLDTNYLQTYLFEPWQKLRTTIPPEWERLNGAVGKLADAHMNKKTAAVAKKLFRALPCTAISLCTPWSLAIVTVGATYVFHVAYGPLSSDTVRNIRLGVTSASAILAAYYAVSFIATRNSSHLVSFVVYAVFTAALIAKRKAIKI